MRLFLLRTGFLFCLTQFAISSPASPQEVQQDPNVNLSIRFVSGSAKFHVGERIQLELSFTTAVENTYQMSTASYDRSGRLNLEHFHMTPNGRDPLEVYYKNLFAFIGGGLSSEVLLSTTPQIIHEDMNEWVAPDSPGHYSLYVTSGRVSKLGGPRPIAVESRSNTLEFDVERADEMWQQEKLSEIQSILGSNSSTADEVASAIKDLRYLDTPDSIAELVKQLGRPGKTNHWDFYAGLISSRRPNQAFEFLRAQLGAPDIAITYDYLFAMCHLKFGLTHEPPPPYQPGNAAAEREWQALIHKRMDEFNQLFDQFSDMTATFVNVKIGEAKGETISTVLMTRRNGKSTSQTKSKLSDSDIADSFLLLSPERQVEFLGSNWEQVKSPAMKTALEGILHKPMLGNQELRGVALERYQELDAKAAEPLIVAEIREPHLDGGHSASNSAVTLKVLESLPNETLPEFDELLAARLENGNSPSTELDAALIGRYATKAILTRVKAFFDAHLMVSCRIGEGLSRYFLRTDPDYIIPRMISLTNCVPESLTLIVQMHRWGEVEPGMIQKLDDPNLWNARRAAEVLQKYGGRNAKEALWDRLKRFHEQWADRENEFSLTAKTPRDVNEAISFEFGLVESIGKAQGWLLDDDEITELESLTVGDEKKNVGSWHQSQTTVGVVLDLLTDGRLQATVGGRFNPWDLESLCQKLAQCPSGTEFSLIEVGDKERLGPVLEAIREVAQRHGFLIKEGDHE
jgi:hypothetical protein